MTKNESKLLSLQGIAKASAFCLLLSAFSVDAAMAVPVPPENVCATAELQNSMLQNSKSFFILFNIFIITVFPTDCPIGSVPS